MEHEQQTLAAGGGHSIRLQVWRPAGPPSHCIQIVHGLGEYADRYARFAAAATARGCSVYCHDQRGHGPDASEPGYFAVKGGWEALLNDVRQVRECIGEEYPDVPVVLLGHSMGSYVAQDYAMRHAGVVSGLILSGSTWPSRPLLWSGKIAARAETWRVGGHRHSPLLDKFGIGRFNDAFKPTRTDHDWLTRDAAEVDRYIADPHCGGPYTAGLWVDLINALLDISTDAALMRIASDLPILITGGGDDAAGGDKGMGKLAVHYAQTGHQRLKVKIYDGGRHEMLNETNRDEATRDWLDWILATSRNSR